MPPHLRPLRIYVELIPHDHLAAPRLLRALRTLEGTLRAPDPAGHAWQGPLELVLKLILPRPGEDLPPSLLRLLHPERRPLLPAQRVWLWGQLADRSRVYLNLRTWPHVLDGWRCLLRLLRRHRLPLEGAFFDLEPDRSDLQLLSDALPLGAAALAAHARPHRAARQTADLQRAVLDLQRDLDAPLLAACAPITALPDPLVDPAAAFLGTPLCAHDGAPIWPALAVMNYTSFLLPLLGGPHQPLAWRATAHLGALLAARHHRWSARRGIQSSVICGTNCIGILGDEPSYPHAHAMTPLLHAAARAEPGPLEVFNLTGLLFGPHGFAPDRPVDLPRLHAWGAALGAALRTPPAA